MVAEQVCVDAQIEMSLQGEERRVKRVKRDKRREKREERRETREERRRRGREYVDIFIF